MLFPYLTLQVLSLDTSSCQPLQCTPGPTRSICIQPFATFIQISPCVNGLECNTTSLNTELSSWPTVTCTHSEPEPDLCESIFQSLFTGQFCCVDSNCISLQCTNDHCAGRAAGSTCIKDEECEPNYYCNSTCLTSQVENCERDNQCASGFGCLNGDCVQFHTLDNGIKSERAVFCKSNFTFAGLCDVIYAVSDGEDLGEGLQCKIGQQCLYYTRNNNTLWDEGSCLCAGVGGSGSGFCGKHADKNEIVLKFYEALVYNESQCTEVLASTDDPDTLYMCGSIGMNAYNYSKVMIERYKYFNLYKSSQIDHCARPLGIFNPWYDNTTYLSFGALIKVALAILSII